MHPNPIFDSRSVRQAVTALAVMMAISSLGCRAFNYDAQSPNLLGEAPMQNPLIVPMLDRWYVMDQVSNEIDNYFKIYREERIRVLDGVMSEGWIETHPAIGGTLLEPWKRDSTQGFEKMHATLQTVRRFAKIRVIPTVNSYQIDLKIFKELEDIDQPMGSAVSGQLRHDSSLDVDRDEVWLGVRDKNWIPLGRDFSLENQILRNIQNRLTQNPEAGMQ
ncbi:MAG: hypothetical protein ACI87E_003014 [Mariniblastus sp.]|jgi:hypothetical protein